MALLRRPARRRRPAERVQGRVQGRVQETVPEAVQQVVQEAGHGIDRLLRDVRTGRFERSLSALTAVGGVVTALEIFTEHDKASFGNRMMWWPIVLNPVLSAAGVAGAVNKRAAKTALPIASLLLIGNGLQGTYLHMRGVAQRPGGWRLARYNMEMGPPVFAPLLVTMVGGMGLLAAILRREGS